MNLSTLNKLGAKAKPIATSIARWAEREGVGYDFEPARGKHPRVRLSFNRQSRIVYFSGTASDVRTIENVLQNCRKEARSMGWKPRKETPVETVARTLSDLPKVVERNEPAPSVVKRYEPPSPQIPRPPNKDARNEWIFDKMESGAHQDDLAKELTRAGWAIQPQSVYAQYRLMKRDWGEAKFTKAKPAEVVAPELVEHRAIDPLVLAIAEAIAPMVREQLAKQSQEIQALRAKADKWDAIAGLVKEA